MTKEEQQQAYKEAVKEALSEWLDKKSSNLIKWIFAVAFAEIVRLIVDKGWVHF